MGTDIHYVFQAKAKDIARVTQSQTPVTDPEEWIDIDTKYEGNRHYLLFAVLADVRNGFGFAGSYRHEPLRPILEERRGLPDDFGNDYDFYRDQWMGDHSYNWLLGSEMLNWTRLDRSLVFGGVLSREEFNQWDGVSEPQRYSGGVWGSDITTIVDKASAARCLVSVDEEQRDAGTGLVVAPVTDWTHIQVYWRASLQEQLEYFFDGIIKPLVEEYGDIRMVFGFDS